MWTETHNKIWVPNYRDCTKSAEPRDMKPLQSLLQNSPLLSISNLKTTISSACNKPLWLSPNALRLYLNLWGCSCLSEISGKAKSLPQVLSGVLILLADRSDNSNTVCLVHLAVCLLTCLPSVLQDVLAYSVCKIANINISFLSVRHPSI